MPSLSVSSLHVILGFVAAVCSLAKMACSELSNVKLEARQLNGLLS